MTLIPTKKAALVAILDNNNQVLLYRRKNTWYEQDKLALVGGNIDDGESPAHAAVREVFEETDILIKPQNLTLLTEAIDRGYHITYYICKDWSGTPTNKEPDRCSELVWHSIDNLPDDTIPVIKTILTTHDPA